MKKMFSKKLIIIAVVAVLAVAAVITTVIVVSSKFNGSSGKAVVYADTVETIMNYGGLGSVNRYTGVAETQKSIDIKLDADKTVKTIFVEVGDVVEEGTPLFEYDTEELNLKLAEANLEIERLQTSLQTSNAQIEQLEKEKKNASEEDKLSYTAEILSLQSAIQQAEYDIKVKELEISNLNESINTAVVTSTAGGVVKEINETPSEDLYGMGTSDAFISIVATGDFRIKGKISEQNVYDIYEDMEVLVYSRVDDSVWTGVIEEIDTESTQEDNNNIYIYGSDSGEASSNYAFYIQLDSSDNLLIGQHVYIEPDVGQYTPGDSISLMESFIVQDEEDPYVWALDKNDKLEKRKVTLGEYDSISERYEIVDGLEISDYIAFPSDYCKAGASAIKDTGNTVDDSIYYREDGFSSGDYYDEDQNTYYYDEAAGILYEYDADGNLLSACDDEGNMTYYDEDGNEIVEEESSETEEGVEESEADSEGDTETDTESNSETDTEEDMEVQE